MTEVTPISKPKKRRPVRISRLDANFSLYIRLRDGRRCQRCFKQYPEGAQGVHNSHFVGRRNKAVRWDQDNCVALCMGCHEFFETHKATLYREWMIERLGQERFDSLVARSRAPVKRTQAEMAELGAEIRSLLRGLEE